METVDRQTACLHCTLHCHHAHGIWSKHDFSACQDCSLFCSGVHVPYFFKYVHKHMEGTYARPRMPIPAAFVDIYMRDIDLNKEIKLEGPDGQIWPIKVSANPHRGLFFGKGWKTFAVYYFLKEGGLLFFQFVGYASFNVQIFDKLPPTKERMVKNVVEINDNENNLLYESKTGHKLDAQACKTNEFLFLGSKNKPIRVDLKQERSSPQSLIEAATFIEETAVVKNNVVLETIDQGNSFVHECMSGHDLQIRACKTSEIPFLGFNDKPVPVGMKEREYNTTEALMIKSATSTEVTLCHHRFRSRVRKRQVKNNNSRQRFTHEYPYPLFIKTICHSHVKKPFRMRFPEDFCKEHMPTKSCYVTLIDTQGGQWKISWTAYTYRDHRLANGWDCFCARHQLKEGDICVFEVVDRRLVTIMVRIYKRA